MTTLAKRAKQTTVTIRDTFTAPMFTRESIETLVGTLRLERSLYAPDVTADIRISLLNGRISVDASLEIPTTTTSSDERGR